MMAAKKKQSKGDELAAIERLAGSWSNWKQPAEALERVKAVPTIFPMLDVATRVGGWPIERVGLIHGPSNEGKSLMLLGLGLSFLKRGHLFGFVDAEFTTPIEWVEQLMGDYAKNPGFVACRPRSYENTIEAVREAVRGVAAAREAGDIPEETSMLLGIDSLEKLVPENFLEKMQAEEVKNGADGANGRAGMILANMHKAWLKELVPLLYFTKTALVFIARESANVNAQKFERTWKVAGGASPYYDSSLVARVTRGFVKDGEKVECERHAVRIYKTKVGAKADKYVDAAFHSFTDPPRFDLARDVLEMAVACGVLKKTGAKIERPATGEVLGIGAAKAAAELRNNPQLLAELEAEVRGSYQPDEGVEEAA